MKKFAIIIVVFAFALKACAQVAPFTKSVEFKAGFILGGVLYDKMPVSDWFSITNKPDFNMLYKPASYQPTWDDIAGKPELKPLSQAIEELGYLPIPERTTTEIDAIILPQGKSGIIKDKTTGFYKLWDGTKWSKIIITNQ